MIDQPQQLTNQTVTDGLKVEEIEGRIREYEVLREDMSELRKKSHVETMVPINKIAYFRGKLKHQNELLVFLGEGYFVERTVEE
jgi:prefoldin alpha subunit